MLRATNERLVDRVRPVLQARGFPTVTRRPAAHSADSAYVLDANCGHIAATDNPFV